MRTLVLKIAEKFCETLSAGVIGEPKWKECLALIDAELNLDASFLLLDRNRGDDVELVDTTTNKLSTFSGDSSDQFSLEGPFLSEVSKAKVWGWHPLERTRFLDDPLWELLWITMNLGAYSGPHTVCAISLPGSTHNNDTSGGNTHNNDTSGVIILFMPADYIGENSKEWPECASLLAHTFSVAALCSSAQRLAQARLAHNESEFFARVIGGGNALNLHRIFQPLQGVELRAETIREIAGRSVEKHVDAITAYVQDASANLRAALYASIRNQPDSATRQFAVGTGRCDAKKIIDSLVKKFSPQASLGQKSFIVRFRNEPANFPMPEGAFEEVMANLIHNAVKYSYSNTKIKVTFHQLVHGAEIEVTSYGIAIRAEDGEKIFFYGFRTPEAVQMEYAGVGMGLPAARKIAAEHGAQLELTANQPMPGEAHTRFGLKYRNTFTLRSRK